MLQDKLNELFEEEVGKKVKDIKSELKKNSKRLEELQLENLRLNKENEELNNTIEKADLFATFKSLINIDNIRSIISQLDLKKNNIPINGMYSESIPAWFALLFEYYEDRDNLFQIYDLFNVEYPLWAKKYKMPYEYNKEELKLFIDNIHDRYITNGEMLKCNIGFFWENVKSNQGDTFSILTSKIAFNRSIPWQLILMNPLWKSDDLFEEIINAIKEKKSNAHYYFAIQSYQEISEEQINEMAKYLPKSDFYSTHKTFIENNKNIIKENQFIAEHFKDNINDNKYSSFYYLNYPIDMQKQFVKNYNKRGFYNQLDLIKNMDISKEDKIELLVETSSDNF